ncbi:MAG TPA: NAD(P)-binding protein, partial [Lachnospiraceae bacterium]|nr:NAD(P)-binding protein [Lachnospiraceae bacterium]
MIQISQIKLPVSKNEQELADKIIQILQLKRIYHNRTFPDFTYKIIRRSLDARKKPALFFVYSVAVYFSEKEEPAIMRQNRNENIILTEDLHYVPPKHGSRSLGKNPVIVGSGPAGLFCAYLLAHEGYCPIVLERGENVDNRVNSVEKFWAGEAVNPESNVQFGEGGAGTFSDGKLNTLIKDRDGRNHYVLDTFVRHGAPKECAYIAKPHVGTDKLIKIVKSMRKEIIDLG